MILKKPLIVHLHLYYEQTWNEILSYLQNLSDYPFDLYVTITSHNVDTIENIKKI